MAKIPKRQATGETPAPDATKEPADAPEVVEVVEVAESAAQAVAEVADAPISVSDALAVPLDAPVTSDVATSTGAPDPFGSLAFPAVLTVYNHGDLPFVDPVTMIMVSPANASGVTVQTNELLEGLRQNIAAFNATHGRDCVVLSM